MNTLLNLSNHKIRLNTAKVVSKVIYYAKINQILWKIMLKSLNLNATIFKIIIANKRFHHHLLYMIISSNTVSVSSNRLSEKVSLIYGILIKNIDGFSIYCMFF